MQARKMSHHSETPVIVLVAPQMGENIGAAARAMANCGLKDLRLVRPRDGWPNERAIANASGAFDVMNPVSVFEATATALHDCTTVFATTARRRDLEKPVLGAKEALHYFFEEKKEGGKTAFLFGPERTGLEGPDVAAATHILTIPLYPGFTSLNLAQAVLIVAYEWRMQWLAQTNNHSGQDAENSAPLATEAERQFFYARLESLLDERGFFKTNAIKPTMMKNLVNFFARSRPTAQELKTLHGVLTALSQVKE